MEGLKKTFNFRIDDQGNLRMDMVEFREATKHHQNKAGIMTIEIMDGGDVIMMQTRYRKHILPKAIEGFRNLGNNYTAEQADIELVRHTVTRNKSVSGELWIIKLEDLDRELLKKYMDEVTIFMSQNLNTIV